MLLLFANCYAIAGARDRITHETRPILGTPVIRKVSTRGWTSSKSYAAVPDPDCPIDPICSTFRTNQPSRVRDAARPALRFCARAVAIVEDQQAGRRGDHARLLHRFPTGGLEPLRTLPESRAGRLHVQLPLRPQTGRGTAGA